MDRETSKSSERPAESIQPNNEYEDAEKNYQPRSPKFWAILIGMYLALFLVALDRTILATAIPAITDEFGSINDIGWYGSSYMLAAACLFPVSGRVYQLYPTKWVYMGSIIVFEIGSALCGAAPSSSSFIVGRAIAGAGSAGVFSGGVMIIMPLVPLRKRPTYTSFFGLAFGVSSVLGPVLGGLFTEHITWRWCFYINLPIGGFTLLAIFFFFNFESTSIQKTPGIVGQIKQLDPLGLLLLAPSMACLILALQWGGSTYAWSAPTIIGLLVTFAVLFVLFIAFEVMTPKTAMAPTRVFLNRSVASCMLFTFLIYGSLMSIIYYLTIWFQTTKGDSPTDAGVKTIPIVLSMVIIIILSAKVTERIGYYVPAMCLSPILCSVGAGMLSTLQPDSGHSKWIGYQVLFGLGLGCGFPVSTLAAQTVLPRVDVPIGLAMMFFMQQLGGSIFLAVSQNIFVTRLTSSLSGVGGLDMAAILYAGATELRDVVPSDQIDTVVNAYSRSLSKVFLMAAILSACMIFSCLTVEWKSIKGDKSDTNSSTNDRETEKAEV